MVFTILLGAVVGVIAALTGAGGGILAVPLLIFCMHLTLAQAAPIGLMPQALPLLLARFWHTGKDWSDTKRRL